MLQQLMVYHLITVNRVVITSVVMSVTIPAGHVSNTLDAPLQTGLSERVGLNINRIKMKNYI